MRHHRRRDAHLGRPAQAIVGAGADYVFTIKANQPKLPAALKTLPQTTVPTGSRSTEHRDMIPQSTKSSLHQPLAARPRGRWPRRGAGPPVPVALRRLGQHLGLRDLPRHDDYEDSYLPAGLPVGTAEDALDTASGLYLGDPTAWTWTPDELTAMPTSASYSQRHEWAWTSSTSEDVTMTSVDARSVRVRPPRAADAPALGALHNRIRRFAYAALLPATYLAGRDDGVDAERWATIIADLDMAGRSPQGMVVQVAVDGHDLIGFATVGPGLDADGGAMIELRALYVQPRYHGTGVADRLCRAVLRDGPAYLWTLDGNERAIAYYRKLGFQVDGHEKPHPPTGAREIRMSR